MKRTAFILAGLLVLLSGAVALAAIPSADGTIHGCRKNSNGTLRVIDAEAGQQCQAGETALTWNQTGPQGPTGPAGAQGPTGPAGADGVSGYQLVTDATPVPAGGASHFWSATVLCSPGKKILGGGGTLQLNIVNTLVLVQSAAAFTGDQEGWSVSYQRIGNIEAPTQIAVNAICATTT